MVNSGQRSCRREGSVHGRFQPFHKGHMEYVSAAKERCEFLWIGITKYTSPAEKTPLGRAREKPENNPLTYFERASIIKEALLDAGISAGSFEFVPFPIESPGLLKCFLPDSVPCFTTICEEWNREKIRLLSSVGYEVVVLWEREKSISGAAIREDIIRGGSLWRSWVPDATAKAVDRLGLRERLFELRRASAEGAQ